MKMKKVISILLAAVMIFGLTACGNTAATDGGSKETADSAETEQGGEESTEAASSGDTAGKKITILWPETDSTQVDVMENYLQPALVEKFPDIEFDYIPVGQDSPLKTMSASGDLLYGRR